jgi:hypothetical protein
MKRSSLVLAVTFGLGACQGSNGGDTTGLMGLAYDSASSLPRGHHEWKAPPDHCEVTVTVAELPVLLAASTALACSV